MIIERLEVQGGFLHGMNLAFSAGLNVLIGPRGAGKTSVLELIRFAVGVPAMTRDAQAAADKQARAVLGDGTVSVYCSVQGQELVLIRTSLDDSPSASARIHVDTPLIVSQNEIEAIGLDPQSRKGMLDRLLDAREDSSRESSRHEVLRIQGQLEQLRTERDALLERAERLSQLPALLEEAERAQLAAAADVERARPLQDAIAAEADQLGRIRSAGDGYRIAEESLRQWRTELVNAGLPQPMPSFADPDLEKAVAAATQKAHRLVAQADDELESAERAVAAARTKARGLYEETQKGLKAKTEELERLESGAGEHSRRVSALRQQLGERAGYLARAEELGREITTVEELRRAALDELERLSADAFAARHARATSVTAEFNARIEVRVTRAAETGAYEATLADLLQGSNLQYKALAAQVAEKMSPRELVEAVETGDAERVVARSAITADRASRLVGFLRGQPLGRLLSVDVDDAVDFALLDGQDYKPTRDLSMGQRCTIVLPLLLAEERESILLDQPEDHLDNAFIVDTLVRAIKERAASGQVIVATHNANVPVLGDADRIVVLASNGRNGFVATSGELDDEASVQSITTLMEGGREAFARRAAFYGKH